MNEDRTHRATSADGTEITGRVHGLGPPLVLVHAGLGDGELDWITEWANEEEMAALAESGYLEACAKYVPVLLHMREQAGDSDDLGPTDPSVLKQITAPVLILDGTQSHATWPWFTESVRHIAEHVADAEVREVAGAGHMGAWVEPERYAEEMIRFFASRR